MNHIGIDLGGRESQVCVRSESGEIIEEARHRTTEFGRWLAGRPAGRVVVETCTEAFRVATIARQHGHEVRVVAATLVRSLGVGHRGLKNDVRDARILSEASCRMDLPSVRDRRGRGPVPARRLDRLASTGAHRHGWAWARRVSLGGSLDPGGHARREDSAMSERDPDFVHLTPEFS